MGNFTDAFESIISISAVFLDILLGFFEGHLEIVIFVYEDSQ